MNPAVSVIICTRNRADSLRETLASIGRCEVPADLPAELLVVDNASTDHTRQVAESAGLANMPVRHVLEPTPGQCHARNRGLREAAGEVILFTDDDVRVPTDWVVKMSRPILDGDADAVAGSARIASHLRRVWMTDVHRQWFEWDFSTVTAPPTLIGGNMSFRRSVFDGVPGFDTQLGPGALGFGDDTLFALQARAAGYRLRSATDCCVEHHFDSCRLMRDACLRRAEGEGRAEAYLAYHLGGGRTQLLRVREMAHRLLLLAHRAVNLRTTWAAEGCTEREVYLLRRIAACSMLRQLRRQPRKYVAFARATHTGAPGAIPALS